MPIFGPRTAARAPSRPLPLRSRKRPKARMPASARISDRLPILSARRRAVREAQMAARIRQGSATVDAMDDERQAARAQPVGEARRRSVVAVLEDEAGL